MAYILLEDFRNGIDRRRSRVNGVPGSLWTLVNAHITRGGEIEQAKKWVKFADLPPGTKGLVSSSTGELFVFGSEVDPGMPVGVTYKQLVHPSGAKISSILASQLFRTHPYVIAEFVDGSIHHYYGNGGRVQHWDTLAAEVGSNNAVAQALADKVNTSTTHTAAALVAVVTITANLDNIAYDIATAAVGGGAVNDQTLTAVETQAPTASLPQIHEVTVGGTFETADLFQLTLNGITYSVSGAAAGTGRILGVFRRKVYSAVSTVVYFSEIDAPRRWIDGIGTGFIDHGAENYQEPITSIGEYEGKLAFFSQNVVRIWAIDPDPALNAHVQTVHGVGTLSGRSVVPYGSRDVFFLHSSGVRSLRPRDSSGTATFDDVGTAIDTLIQEHMLDLIPGEIALATAIFEPRDNRYWLALGNRIYVFSHFPSNKISAWSYYEPGFEISEFAIDGSKVYARSGDSIYLYGGPSGNEYPAAGETPALVEFPYLSGKKPATFKNFEGFDVSLSGDWQVDMLVDPADENAYIPIGTVSKNSFAGQRIPAVFVSTHCAPRFRCISGGRATLGSMAIHFEGTHEDG